MRKLLIIITVFAVVFFGLYQKQKILILAYKINAQKQQYQQLEEEKSDLLCSFLRQTNLASINQKFRADGMRPQYPREYVRLVPAFTMDQQTRPTILARILGTAAHAEASQ